MTEDPTSPRTLAWPANECEAALIVNALEEQGIRAKAVGEYTFGFRAEAPGGIRVVVAQGDLERACQVLAEVQREQAEVMGPEDDGYEEEPSGAAVPRKPRHFQYSLGALVALQTALCVALAVCRSFSFSPDVVAVMTAIGTLLAVVAATVWIASDMTRARSTWAGVGRLLVPALGVVVLLELIFLVVEVLVR